VGGGGDGEKRGSQDKWEDVIRDNEKWIRKATKIRKSGKTLSFFGNKRGLKRT